MSSCDKSSKTVVQHLREVADRLRIQGEYGPGWSDVADATACTLGADEIEKLSKAMDKTYATENYSLRREIERLRAREDAHHLEMAKLMGELAALRANAFEACRILGAIEFDGQAYDAIMKACALLAANPPQSDERPLTGGVAHSEGLCDEPNPKGGYCPKCGHVHSEFKWPADEAAPPDSAT